MRTEAGLCQWMAPTVPNADVLQTGVSIMDPNLLEETDSLKSGVLTLCGTQGCCPTVDFNNPEEVVLRDDHGGMVRLTSAEWGELTQFVKKSAKG